ncbi:MAG: UDP-N-acetylmuramoyl-L-alanine--D-glutamate ligase [bacterium]|nr:UDP-N-acetylmuramoyl-L-alanine--D-glutamate ligase [bacterium]
MFENKKIFILGMARSGYNVAKLLCKNNEIVITDKNDQDEDKVRELESLGVKFIKTDNPLEIFDSSFDMVIKNPGVMPFHELLIEANKLNIPIYNEMEVAYHFLPKNIKIIGVTGSNGKTTTTTIIYELLKKMNIPVVLGGNIGYPLSEVIPVIKNGDVLLLEISDHQLINFKDFKTDISVLTNLCQTHLDYHGNYENYKNVKHNIFNHHTEKDIAIINQNNLDSIELTKDIKSTREYFNGQDAFIKDDFIFIKNEKIINIDDIKIKGQHNYENIMAALLVINEFGIDKNIIKDFFMNFNGVEHRIEFVCQNNNLKFYNDSKATNPTSTITALNSFNEDVYLILGGMQRNQDFHELDNYIKHVKKIYAIGEVTDEVFNYAKEKNINCEKCYTLKVAMEIIKNDNLNNGVVLLSPASASWDQYDKFETRGNEFKNLAKTI